MAARRLATAGITAGMAGRAATMAMGRGPTMDNMGWEAVIIMEDMGAGGISSSIMGIMGMGTIRTIGTIGTIVTTVGTGGRQGIIEGWVAGCFVDESGTWREHFAA
ncbi:hypothetical protein HDU96_005219 [Phlyctochytrium bullatum]|nr:hypothetical protein HDU96_005219 [Phlyctochytrium bullatum]